LETEAQQNQKAFSGLHTNTALEPVLESAFLDNQPSLFSSCYTTTQVGVHKENKTYSCFSRAQESSASKKNSLSSHSFYQFPFFLACKQRKSDPHIFKYI
jgi:hypothetical protein